MKTYPECIPCFFRQALEAGRRVTNDESRWQAILDRVAEAVRTHPTQSGPPVMGEAIYRAIREVTGDGDPYRSQKIEYNRKALLLAPRLKERIAFSPEPLLEALKLAVAGNVIDFGPHSDFDLEREIETVENASFAIFQWERFRRLADGAGSVFYVGDNAGEIVFDKLLIETIGKPAAFAVRGGPAINDVTAEDAEAVDMNAVATVVDTGVGAPGVFLDRAPREFLERYRRADLIISKGQGNFESLETEERPIAFLLKAKCDVVARYLGVKLGDLVVKVSLPRKSRMRNPRPIC